MRAYRIACKPRLDVSRCFSTARSSRQLKLAYDLHEPPQDGGPVNNPIIFIHGLFGSKKNNRSMSKVFARDLRRPVYAIDLRNHGDSPHDPRHDYAALGQDVEDFIDQHALARPTLIGHSMGAKAAMTVALHAPTKIANLISVDNAPVDAALRSNFATYIQGLRRVDDARVARQADADAILQPFEASLPIRQFLLTNLVRHTDATSGRSWLKVRVPLKTLADALDRMGDFPYKDPEAARFKGPALFVRGTKSHYVADETLPVIGSFFPRFELRDVESGHWVISENPHAFRDVVVEFLADKD